MGGIGNTAAKTDAKARKTYLGVGELRLALNQRFAELGSWRAVAREIGTVNHSTVHLIAVGKYTPKTRALKEALGVVSKRQPEVIRWRWVGRWIAKHGEGFIK